MKKEGDKKLTAKRTLDTQQTMNDELIKIRFNPYAVCCMEKGEITKKLPTSTSPLELQQLAERLFPEIPKNCLRLTWCDSAFPVENHLEPNDLGEIGYLGIQDSCEVRVRDMRDEK